VVRRIVGHVLKLPESRIDDRQPFGSLGLDSLMSIELRNRLETEVGLKLSATVAWNYPTVTELGAHVLSGLDLAPPTADRDARAERPTSDADRAATVSVARMAVAELTDDEVLSALMGAVES
jgi:acyl carrier protein